MSASERRPGAPSPPARPARGRTRRPSTGQLRFLLGWAYADAAAAAARPAALGLLRAVLARRLVLPEVYDLMARVQDAMVQAQARPGPRPRPGPAGGCGGRRGAGAQAARAARRDPAAPLARSRPGQRKL